VPRIVIHKNGETFAGEVKENSNLVVRAGIKQFPFPHLTYGCGMGKCARCASIILAGAEHLPEPNWKEKKLLAANLDRGYRLCCQLWITHDLELSQHDADRVTPAAPTASSTPPTPAAPSTPAA
jgi:ferredoxin